MTTAEAMIWARADVVECRLQQGFEEMVFNNVSRTTRRKLYFAEKRFRVLYEEYRDRE